MDIRQTEFKSLVTASSSRIDLWARVLCATKAQTAAEIGVWKGDFAKEMLEKCTQVRRYFLIDPWDSLSDWNKPFNVDTRAFHGIYAEAMTKTDFASDRRIVLRGRTQDVIEDIPDNCLDFAYIDGDHTLRGITIDLIRLLPKIKDGGVIGGDDFHLNPWQHGKQFEPTLVCPFVVHFCEAMMLPIMALPFDQFVIQKTADAPFSFIDLTGTYKDLSLQELFSGQIA